jgi:hypothetical protein
MTAKTAHTTHASPLDAGLEQIAAYARALVEAHMDRFVGYPADVIEQERATVTRLAAARAAQMRLEYLANQSRRQP